MSLLTLLNKKDFDPRRELFGNGEIGVIGDIADMNRTKLNWRRNLLTRTQQFSQVWATTGSATPVVTDNQLEAPDGTLTASKVTYSSSGYGAVYQQYSVSPGQVYTFSVWFERTQSQIANQIRVYDVTGAANIVAGENFPAGDGWVRHSVTFTIPSGCTSIYVYANSCNGNAGQFNYIWGAQLELGTLTEYQPILDGATNFKLAFPNHALYQDSNGVTPVTAVGDLVGLVVDKSQGGLDALGPELIADPTLTDTTGWVFDAGWSASSGTIIGDNTAAGAQIFANSPEILTQGKWYLVEVEITAQTGNSVRIDCRPFSGGTGATNHASLSGVATHRTIVNNTGANTRISFRLPSSVAPGTVTITSVSVKEIPGHHIYQSTSGSRPALSRVPFGGRRNLVNESERFDQAYWTKTNATVTANQAANPINGEMTADLITATADGGVVICSNAQTAGVVYTQSVWIRTVSGTVTGSIYGTSSFATRTNFTATTTWQRVTNTATSIGGNRFPSIQIDTAGESILVWGAQLETGSTATNYQKTAIAGTVVDCTESGVPDCWYLDTSSNKWMQTGTINFGQQSITRKNFVQNSEDLTAATWTKSTTTILPDAVTGPFSRPADVMYPTTTGTNRNVQFTHTNTLGGYVTSVYAKNYGTTNYYLVFTRGSTQDAFFNLQTGEVTGVASGCAAYMTDAGDGWWRCEFVYDIGSVSTRVQWLPTDATSGWTVTANGTDGIAVTGFQLEVGSRASEYDPTGTDEMTVIAGVRKLSDSGAVGSILELTSVGTNPGAFGVYDNASVSSPNRTAAYRSESAVVISSPEVLAPTTYVVTGQSDRSEPSISLRRNGVNVGSNSDSHTGATYANGVVYVGVRNGVSSHFNGHIFQVIIRGKTTSGSKLTRAEKYIAKKTGLSI